MKRRAKPPLDYDQERQKLIGLGKRSISKSYYPELKKRLDELEHFRALLDRVNDAIFIVDANTGKILDTSGSTDTLLKCSGKSLVNTRFKNILPPHIRRFADNLFQSKTRKIQLETEMFCPICLDAPPVPVEMTINIVIDGDDRQAIIVARDISERKQNEMALKKSHDLLELRVRERTRELQQANQAKSEFLSIVSHELRTPLTSVLGFAKIIGRKLDTHIFPAVDPDDKKLAKEMALVKRNIEIINLEGERLTALINDVLDLAKLEANKVEYTMRRLNPVDFIQRAVEATTALFEEAGLPLLLEVERDLPPVEGDLDRLIQVMVNLFSNSVKFTDSGSVTCRARQVEDVIRISVTDSGIGISKDLLETIFEKFSQGEKSLGNRSRGTGLGLPICSHILDAHGGHIWAESTEGEGSKFIFTLPIAQPAE